jgi:hypothetical protein
MIADRDLQDKLSTFVISTFSMNAKSLKIGSCESIEAELNALNAHIDSYRLTLKEESVWLFLATLGCWSVTQRWLQAVGFFIAIAIFAARIKERSTESKSFPKLFSELELRISELAESEYEKKAGLYDLINIKKTTLSGLEPFRKSFLFMINWFFLAASLIYCLVANFS